MSEEQEQVPGSLSLKVEVIAVEYGQEPQVVPIALGHGYPTVLAQMVGLEGEEEPMIRFTVCWPDVNSVHTVHEVVSELEGLLASNPGVQAIHEAERIVTEVLGEDEEEQE